MKKLLAALVLTLSTAALAQSDAQQDTKAQQQKQQQQGEDTRRIETGIEATEVLPGLSGSKASKPDQQAEANLMNKARAFNVTGTVKSASSDEITLSRQNEKLPDVKLDVREQTQVLLDGKKVAVADIPEGALMRARFQLDGDKPVAVDVNATSPKGKKAPKQQGTQGTQQGTQGTQPAPQQ